MVVYIIVSVMHGHTNIKFRWLDFIMLKIINYKYDVIIATVGGLPTNRLITVYLYCHYPALPCIFKFRSILLKIIV